MTSRGDRREPRFDADPDEIKDWGLETDRGHGARGSFDF